MAHSAVLLLSLDDLLESAVGEVQSLVQIIQQFPCTLQGEMCLWLTLHILPLLEIIVKRVSVIREYTLSSRAISRK